MAEVLCWKDLQKVPHYSSFQNVLLSIPMNVYTFCNDECKQLFKNDLGYKLASDQ